MTLNLPALKGFALAAMLALPLTVPAQTTQTTTQTAPAAPAKAVKKPATPPPSRVEIKTKANQMATGIMAAEAALTPAELD